MQESQPMGACLSGDRGGQKGSGREGQTFNEQGSNPKAVQSSADDWADVVMMRVTGTPSDLHALDARYTEVLQVIAKQATRTRTRHRSQ